MNSTSNIPFLDLITPHHQLEEELTAVFRSVLGTAGFIGGPMVEGFEKDFAQFCDTAFCVGVGSGTDAVRFALMAAGIGAGDIVITVPNTFIATVEAISQAGAQPKFVDIDSRTYNMDPAKLEKFLETECQINGRTGILEHRETHQRIAAILPVHLYGQMADMDAIMEQAERFGLLVIEDACQAHGATYLSKRDGRWHKAGSMGIVAAFSFYPGKNLGACGEAGAVTTNDPEIARKVRMLRDHGQAQKYYHDVEGYNGRLDSIQAGILRVKLAHLAEWNEKRRQAAARYCGLLAKEEVVLPYELPACKSVYHLFVIQVDDREGLKKHLADAGIGTGIHYPIPLHLQKAYAALNYRKGSLPAAELSADRILSLPMFPQLQPEQQDRVVKSVSAFVTSRASAALAR